MAYDQVGHGDARVATNGMQAAKKKINHLVFEAFELSSWKNVSSGRAISN